MNLDGVFSIDYDFVKVLHPCKSVAHLVSWILNIYIYWKFDVGNIHINSFPTNSLFFSVFGYDWLLTFLRSWRFFSSWNECCTILLCMDHFHISHQRNFRSDHLWDAITILNSNKKVAYFSLQTSLHAMFFALIIVFVVGSSVLNTAQSKGISRIDTRHIKTLPGMSLDDMSLSQKCSLQYLHNARTKTYSL